MKPTRDIVHILADKPIEKTSTGLLLNEGWKTLPLTGKVMAVGPLVQHAKVGDRVVFDRYASVQLRGDERLCKESHILAVLDNHESP